MSAPRRLEELPETGKVVVGAPATESHMRTVAEHQGCDYFVSDLCPPDMAYVMDLDQIFTEPVWKF